jgi:peptide chain release factor 2
MENDEITAALAELAEKLSGIEQVTDLSKLNQELVLLEEQATDPNLWNEPSRAQQVTSKLAAVRNEISAVAKLRNRIDDLETLFELARAESDQAAKSEVENEIESVKAELAELEIKTLLSGEYDSREALVTLRSEAGGVDAADWTEMLMRMYLRYCERKGWRTEVYETSYAEEAGIKSTTFAVKAPYAYGMLSVEQGTHRLVRISPFDSQARRHTSFAGVEVVPVVEQSDAIVIPDDEIRVDVYRSSGPGGQGVNTTDSAVRLTHIPTGIVVACQNERSQLQNKATAMALLSSKLLERKRQEEQSKIDALRGDSAGSWGNQMRSYVLAPYQMVKDLRTNMETGNPAAVLDGDLDDFINGGIRWRKNRGAK